MEDKKAAIRQEVWRRLASSPGVIPPFPGQGRAAERLRALPEYKAVSYTHLTLPTKA